MKPICRIVAIGLVMTAMTTPALTTAMAVETQDEVAEAAQNARHLTTDELYKLYSNRSWSWNDGAGYFQASKRKFKSRVRSGNEASYGEGSWLLTQRGRVCFRATWHAMDGAAPAVTCFEHRTDGTNHYQRRVPDGEWYIFAHTPPRDNDEIKRLKYGDRVSRNFERNRRYIAENTTPPELCDKKDPVVKLLCGVVGP